MTSDTLTLRKWLSDEPFVLAMSSGFFGFYAHCGMLTALEEEGLMPAAYSGSSAGALIAGFAAAGLSAKRIARTLAEVRLADFWDPAPGAGLLAGDRFRKLLETRLPVEAFEDCRTELWVSAFDVFRTRTRVFTHGPLAPAIHASCAVPVLFQPVWLDRRPHLDGGVADRPGLAGVPRDRRVFLHHLAARSPWRLHPPQVPPRPNLKALSITSLARINPFGMDRGITAFQQAYRATKQGLDRPFEGPVVTVNAAS